MTLFGVFSCVRGLIDNDNQNQKPDDNDYHYQNLPCNKRAKTILHN